MNELTTVAVVMAVKNATDNDRLVADDADGGIDCVECKGISIARRREEEARKKRDPRDTSQSGFQ